MNDFSKKVPGHTPGEDDLTPPRPPGSHEPEPDVPDFDDEVGDVVRPVKT